MKSYKSIDKRLKNVSVLQVETGKNPTTPLYSETNKQTKMNPRNIQITKREHVFKGFWKYL